MDADLGRLKLSFSSRGLRVTRQGHTKKSTVSIVIGLLLKFYKVNNNYVFYEVQNDVLIHVHDVCRV